MLYEIDAHSRCLQVRSIPKFCIESVPPDFEISRTDGNDMWRNWFAPYIIGSEQLISTSRNTIYISHLEELDVDLIERKDRIQLQPAEFDSICTGKRS